jgi:hypothetical protein
MSPSTSPDAPASSPAASANPSTFDRVARWVSLIAGVLILLYALMEPVNPPLITLAGSLIGIDPVRRAAK